MKKEVLIAVLIGLSMGLIITYGIYRVQTAVNQPPVTDVAEVMEAGNATSSGTEALAVLSIHSPEPGLIQSENTTNITGTTLPNAYVVIFVNDEDQIVETDNSGNFTQDLNLNAGTNLITTHVIDSMGQTASEERVIVVSDIYERRELDNDSQDATESAEPASIDTDTLIAQANTDKNDTASESEDEADEENEEDEVDATVTENVKKLIKEQVQRNQVQGVNTANAATQQRAIFGEVVRVTDAAITIQRPERQQIVALDKALLLRNNNTIKVADIAVGNWATILGTIVGEDMKPDFILISNSSPKPAPQKVVMGTITELTRTSMTIQPRSGEGEMEITINTNTDLEDVNGDAAVFASLEVDTTVLVSATENDNQATIAKTIRSLAETNVASDE